MREGFDNVTSRGEDRPFLLAQAFVQAGSSATANGQSKHSSRDYLSTTISALGSVQCSATRWQGGAQENAVQRRGKTPRKQPHDNIGPIFVAFVAKHSHQKNTPVKDDIPAPELPPSIPK